MSTTNDIRQTFLDFFNKADHAILPSSPLVPRNDPTLMFTNAGMVQFKNIFTGAEKPLDPPRATTSQKCVRAGGKHNDLENVGHTARHHTFFEMLGNFSFGDYFKEGAIEHAWNLVTKDFALPKNKLLVTVYAEDNEAADLWKKIAGLPDDRIIRIATSDNFWQMGDTGPCGPCSEIFFDHGDHIPGGPPGSPDEDGDRFIEIWNLVFMQYEQKEDGSRIDLPKPSIDTGMGLERTAAILQGKHDNYDIDLMRALIENSAHLSNTHPDGPHQVSHRVIADHLRSSAFLIADGVLPSNEGRGYVLRRIMRRAMRHAHLLGCDDPLMHKLVPSLIDQMGHHFTELGRAEALITETLKLEEGRFKQTLGRGLRLLEEATNKLGSGETLPGEVAFKLYDTYGFPLDLTQDVLKSQNRAVDLQGFTESMEKQKAEARAAWSGSGEAATDTHWFDLKEKIGAVDFLGYKTEEAQGEVHAIVSNGTEIDKATDGDKVVLITNQTPFYGESGGQVGDTGVIKTANGAVFTVTDTKKPLEDFIVHYGVLSGGSIGVGDVVDMLIDHNKRSATRANHSATHLLHEALRRQLGDHITQKGSLVAPDRLRFDISHPKAISKEELATIEAEVNERIRANSKVETHLMTPDDAIEKGAMALFGEKYGDEVRVLSMGGAHETSERAAYSVELCGGTHVTRTGDIGLFKIVSESAVASGVRRIEALTGSGAMAYLSGQDERVSTLAQILKTTPDQLGDRLQSLMDERKKLEKQVSDLRQAQATGGTGGNGPESQDIQGIKFSAQILDGTPPKELKPMADALKQKLGSGIVTLIAVNEGKASLVVGVTDDLTAKFDAVSLVKAGSAALGGKGGGGRPDMAQAGGMAENPQAAVNAIEALIKDQSQAA